jgi:hypothetical protein
MLDHRAGAHDEPLGAADGGSRVRRGRRRRCHDQGGVLTIAEYQQLLELQTRLKPITPNTLKNVNAMLSACEQTQQLSPLLRDVRAECDSEAGFLLDEYRLRVAESGCTTYPTTSARLNCLNRPYSKFANAMASFYGADVAVSDVATTRGFSGRCLAVLATPRSTLRKEQRVVKALRQVIVALRAKNLLEFEAESGIAPTAFARLGQGMKTGPQDIALCPHQ